MRLSQPKSYGPEEVLQAFQYVGRCTTTWELEGLGGGACSTSRRVEGAGERLVACSIASSKTIAVGCCLTQERSVPA